MDAAISAERERETQCLLRLRRAHRHRDDLSAVSVAEAGGVRDGVRVEAVELERHALPLERLRLVVELDRVAARDLLHEADDLHFG
jgi:hypothetical protein